MGPNIYIDFFLRKYYLIIYRFLSNFESVEIRIGKIY